jgi:hypothetical protein
MRRIEVVFLAAVLGFASVFVGRSLSQAVALLPTASDEAAFLGTAGKPRDVDMGRLRLLLRQRALSDHEAEFYKPAKETPEGTTPSVP